MRILADNFAEKLAVCVQALGKGTKDKAKLSCSQGQASTEYIIAVFVGLAIVLILAGLYGYFAMAGSEQGSHSSKTYLRAPYTLPSQGSGSEQWIKDLIVH